MFFINYFIYYFYNKEKISYEYQLNQKIVIQIKRALNLIKSISYSANNKPQARHNGFSGEAIKCPSLSHLMDSLLWANSFRIISELQRLSPLIWWLSATGSDTILLRQVLFDRNPLLEEQCHLVFFCTQFVGSVWRWDKLWYNESSTLAAELAGIN